MHKNSRIFQAGALLLLMVTAACGPREPATPLVIQTMPGIQTDTPSALETESPLPTATSGVTATAEVIETAPSTSSTKIPGIPVTGADINLLDYQFCIDNLAHALLVFPVTATFELIASSPTGTTPGLEPACSTIETHNGRQVVLCSAQENTTITLNVCSEANRCAEQQVDLQTCTASQPVLQLTRPVAAPTKDRDEPNISTPVPPTAAPTNEPVNTPIVNPTEPSTENPTEPPAENPTEPPPIIPPIIPTIIP